MTESKEYPTIMESFYNYIKKELEVIIQDTPNILYDCDIKISNITFAFKNVQIIKLL